MQSQEIYTELSAIFRDLFDNDHIVLKPETSAGDIDGWDSLAHVNLLAAIEFKMNIKFKTAEIEALHNVGHLVGVIETKLAGRG